MDIKVGDRVLVPVEEGQVHGTVTSLYFQSRKGKSVLVANLAIQVQERGHVKTKYLNGVDTECLDHTGSRVWYGGNVDFSR